MDEMVAWLRAHLDADEVAARSAMHSNGVWTHDGVWGSGTSVTDAQGGSVAHGHGSGDWSLHAHIARHDPASVLRDVAAKRRILDGPNGGGGPDHYDEWSETVRLLAEAYGDRPGYQKRWRPARVGT